MIDDDVSILHALGMFLELEGYNVETAAGYDKKLDNVKVSDLPDLIVLDILLSDENGCEIAQRLKASKKTADVPIVMVSAHPDGRQMSKRAGADAYLPKPFDVDDLLSTFSRLGVQPQMV